MLVLTIRSAVPNATMSARASSRLCHFCKRAWGHASEQACLCACMCASVRVSGWTGVRACVRAGVRVLADSTACRGLKDIQLHLGTHARSHTRTNAHLHATTHAHTHARTHARTHTRKRMRTRMRSPSARLSRDCTAGAVPTQHDIAYSAHAPCAPQHAACSRRTHLDTHMRTYMPVNMPVHMAIRSSTHIYTRRYTGPNARYRVCACVRLCVCVHVVSRTQAC